MNILVFTDSSSSLNSVRPEAEMYIAFADAGHKVTILTGADSEYASVFRSHGIRLIDCQPKGKVSLRTIKTVRDELKRTHYDILYVTNSKSIPNGAFAAIGTEVKLVTYRGTTGGLYRHDPSAYLTHLHPRVDGIVCVSEAVRQDVVRRVWKNKDKVVAIHKGHNLQWYDVPPADLREFGISDNDFTLICAVNVRPSKGIPVLLQAIEQLSDIPDLHLLLVGKNMDRYRNLISKNSMHEHIHVTGYRHDVPSLITACDLLVQPSISGEGLPRAVMESMGCGTPAVLTTAGGGKEVVENGETGFVVPTRDPGAIAKRVRELYNNPELLEKMGRKGRKKIASDLSCQRSSQRYLDYFRMLLDK
ncbi:MAG: glycosyltransferase family 4 protein [Desulfuromonadales bacterium]